MDDSDEDYVLSHEAIGKLRSQGKEKASPGKSLSLINIILNLEITPLVLSIVCISNGMRKPKVGQNWIYAGARKNEATTSRLFRT